MPRKTKVLGEVSTNSTFTIDYEWFNAILGWPVLKSFNQKLCTNLSIRSPLSKPDQELCKFSTLNVKVNEFVDDGCNRSEIKQLQ